MLRCLALELVATTALADVVLDLYDENRRIIAAGQSERYTRVEIIGIAARSLEASARCSGRLPIILKPSACHATRCASS